MVWFKYHKTGKKLPMSIILADKLERLGLGTYAKEIKEVEKPKENVKAKEPKSKTTKK